jgi:GAF domain-containing protein
LREKTMPRKPTSPAPRTTPSPAEPSASPLPLPSLDILRDAAHEINRISPETSLRDALRLIVQTAVRLMSSPGQPPPAATICIYDAELRAFDPAVRVNEGYGPPTPIPAIPRHEGMGATAIRLGRRILSYEEDNIPMHPADREAGLHTIACYPLMVAGKPTGVLYVGLRVDRRFTDEELLLLDIFAHQAASAIHNTQRFEGINRTLQRKVDELERLRAAERLISSRPNLDDTLREILRTAMDITRAGHGSLRLLDKRACNLRLAALSGAGSAPTSDEDALPLEEHGSVMGWVAVHRQPVRIGDLRQPPWNEIYRPLHFNHRMYSELAVPLLGAGGALEGVINLESPILDAFHEEDQRLLEALATQAVIALQEAKMLEALDDVSSRMLTEPMGDLLAFIIERACDLINAPHGAVWVLPSDHPDTLVVRAATAGHTIGETLPLRGSLIGKALHDRATLTSADVREDARFLRKDLARRMGWVSGLIVPLLMRDGTPRGALTLYAVEPRAFSAWDTRLLTWLANHTAIAVQDAEALEQLAQARERQALAETFAALGDVAANLLHRVNNLVGIIPVRVQGILEKSPAVSADSYAASSLAEIETSARTAMQAAREAMAYLRPSPLQPTFTGTCLQTALERIPCPANVRVTVEGLDTLPPVLAGEEQLRLVFVNLVENAFDALAELPKESGCARTLEIHGGMAPARLGEASRVEIRITDSGPGIPPEGREHIFDLTYSTKRTPGRLGFGLWWVKTLVRRFGGEIFVADDTAAGTAFVMRLPCAPGPDCEPSAEKVI